MRVTTFLLFLFFLRITGYSQTEKNAEKSALCCINNSLATAGKDINYLLTSSLEYSNLISNMDSVKFEKKKKEVDSILNASGIYKNEHLDINLLRNCMLSSYDLMNEKNDSASSYFQLLNHLIYLSQNPSNLKELSPSLHLEAIKSIITIDNQDNDFYKVFSFILFQGIVKEFENYAKGRKDTDKIIVVDSESDDEQNIEIFTIVDDDIQIVEDLTLDKPIKSNFSCGEEIYIIVEEMPKFEGGIEAIKKYFHVNSTEKHGKVYIQFLVDCNGDVINPMIIRGLSPLTNKVAVDLVNSMPKWIPGEQRGKKVNVQQTFAVIFD